MYKGSSNKKHSKEQNEFIILFSFVIFISVIIVFVFYNLYQVSKKNVINMWNNNAIELSKDVEYYLNTPKDAVKFTAQKVEQMISDGVSNSEIKKYLEEETSVYSTLIESNSTGVYGYCNGGYLDGSGWIPPKDYDPKERPWYKSAQKADGQISFEEPFLNLQTNTMMMSVSVLLSDKESVISMDIFLDSIQEIEEKMKDEKDVDVSMVIDKSGIIVSHSDMAEVGKNYLTDGNEAQKKLVNTILAMEHGTFTLQSDYGDDLVFTSPISSDWYSVLILNEKDVFKSIKHIYVLSAMALVGVFFGIFVILSIYVRKQTEVSELQNNINSIADVYEVMDILDLKKMTFKTLRNRRIEKVINSSDNTLLDLDTIIPMLVAESSRPMLKQFMSIDTLEKRLRNVNSLSHEYLGNDGKWERIQLIVSEWADDGSLSKIIMTIQSIDEDKRQQEHLRKMAETDPLTGIMNRNGGESKIYSCMESGKSGMFILMDADNFKYVNDTFGHDKGDEVIKAIANCLEGTFRDSDVVYRMGGDEFVAFATNVNNTEIGTLVINRLFNNIDKIEVEGVTGWSVHISAGIVMYDPKEKTNFATLYKQADNAMYKSKQIKGNSYTFA